MYRCPGQADKAPPAIVEVGGAKVAFTEAGAGEAMLLLHSSASSGAQWRTLATELAERYRVLAPDLFGYGETGPWPGRGPMTLADEAALVAALMSRCSGPVHLVGHSYGGAVALRVAAEQPERLTSLTLIEPVAFHLLRDDNPLDRTLFAEVQALAELVCDAVLRGEEQAAMARFVDYWNGDGTWAQIPQEKCLALARCTRSVALNFQSTMGEPTPLESYRRVGVPTLILCGETAPLPTYRIAELIASALPLAWIEVAAGAGHMLPLTHPEFVNAAIADHLDRAAVERRLAA